MHEGGAAERRDRINALVVERRRISVAELSRLLEVSPVTIRRDLDLLEAEGRICRQHGWATLEEASVLERTFREKADQAMAEKERIAERAAAMVKDGDTVMLSVGTTTTAVARQLKSKSGLTIITTAINIAAEVVHWPESNLIIPGGMVREKSYAMVGPFAAEALRRLTADIAFIGVDGISLSHGLTTPHVLEGEVDRTMVDAARRVVVVADSRKLGRSALTVVCPVTRVHALVTDSGAPEHICRQLMREGIEVYRV